MSFVVFGTDVLAAIAALLGKEYSNEIRLLAVKVLVNLSLEVRRACF